jgi:RHS repeat-associated protein
MKRFAALVLILLASLSIAHAAPKDPAPLPDDVVQRLIREPFKKPTDNLARQVARRLDETEVLIRRWEAGSESGVGEAERSVQLEAQRQALANLRGQVLQRLSLLRSQDVATLKPGKKRVNLDKAHSSRTAQVQARFDQLDKTLADMGKAASPEGRRQALSAARALIHQVRGQLRDQSSAHSVVPWSTERLDAVGHLTPRKSVSTLPRYLSEQRERYFNSVASTGPILLAAAPTTPLQAGQCYVSGTVDASDLAATPDVQKDDSEIGALAETLDYSPAKILAWVHDNIRYEPYWGSLKGAKGTLVAGAGNATDHASLMIALLRASNIPARYVTGRIQINDSAPTEPGGRALRWLGMKTYAAAAMSLTLGGVDAGPVETQNDLGATVQVGVNLSHVWVEACVPYANYRGASVSNAGHRWVPLDAAFKDKEYRQDIDVDVAFDYSFAAGRYMFARTDELPHERYAKMVEAALLPSGKDMTDLSPEGPVKSMKLDILPSSLPYSVTSFIQLTGAGSVEPASLPSQHRYILDVTLKQGNTAILTRSVGYPDAALKRLTLSFTPADATTQSWWNGWDGSYALLPASGVLSVKPVLKLEGTEVTGVTAGPAALTSANRLTLIMKLRLPDADRGATCVADSGSDADAADPDVTCVNKAVYDSIKPGGYHALHAYALQASDRYLKERAQLLIDTAQATPTPPTPQNPAAYDASLGEFLHLALVKYMRYSQDVSRQVGEALNVQGLRGNDIGLTTVDIKTEFLADLPYAIKAGGLLIDVKGGKARFVKLDSNIVLLDSDTPAQTAAKQTALVNEIWPALKLETYSTSALEHYIWQEMARTDAISTVRGLQYASETGIPIVTLNSANIAQYDSLMDVSMRDAITKAQLTNYVNEGSTVTVPQRKLAYVAQSSGNVWNGTAFMAENQALGYLSASISGQFGGGFADLEFYDLSFLWDFDASSEWFVLDWWSPDVGEGVPDIDVQTVPVQISDLIDGGCRGANTCAGDPVNLVTGNFYHVERDLSIAGRGGMPIVFERTYNSRKPQDGPLGHGWTHSFNSMLKFYGVEDGKAKLAWIDGSGGVKFFASVNHSDGAIAANSEIANPANASLINPDGIFVVVKREADGQYSVREKNGLSYRFQSVVAPAAKPARGLEPIARLLSITDRNNNVLSLSYNGNDLSEVSDAVGRKLAFTYASGHITRIQFKSASGVVLRTHEYTYDGAGNLTVHKSPATLLDAAKNPPVTYQYYSSTDGAKLDHAMKQYQLPRGNGMKFHYYVDGRVFKHAAFGTGGEDLGQENTFHYNDFRRETVMVNERGFTRSYLFDSLGNPATVTEENGAFRTYTYDQIKPYDRLSKTDPYGLTTQYQYDDLGNVSKITNPDGNAVSYTDFTAYNQPRRIQDARGNWTLLKYDLKGNLTDEVKLKSSAAPPTADIIPATADILAWRMYQYDGFGNRTGAKRLKDFAGAALGNFASGTGPVVTTAYDSNGLYPIQASRVGDKDGDGVNDTADSDTLAFDGQGRQTQGIDADWQAVQSQYDAVDRVIRATDGLGQWRDYQFDANGNPIEASLTVEGDRLDSNSALYDGADRQIQALDAAGNASRWEYDARGNALKITDPDGYTLAFEYDAMDRWHTATDKSGNSATRDVDISGRLRRVTDPNGNAKTQTWWDASRNGRQKEAIDALGRKTTQDWDANGNLITVTDNLGQVSKIFHDALNRPVRELAPPVNGVYPVTCRKYDALGNLVEIWAGGSTDPTTSKCDLTGADPNLKKQVSHTYNDFGWKVKETDPLGHLQTWQYDRYGNVSQYTDAKGQTSQYTWDYGHQFKTRSVKAADGSDYQSLSYSRNALGQPLSISQSNPALTENRVYDAAHRLTSIGDNRGGKSLAYNWSAGGLLNNVTDSDGDRTDYLYDGVGRLIGLWAPNYDYIAFAHDAGGRLSEKWLPNGASARYTWNADDTLATLTNYSASNTELTSHQYAYDSLGRRYRHTETLDALGTKYLQYGYDALSRLTEVKSCSSDTFSTCSTDETTLYDVWSNRASQTKAGATLAYVHDTANQLLEIRKNTAKGALQTALVYDANGNLTKKCVGGSVIRTATDCGGTTLTNLAYNPLDQLVWAQRGTASEAYAYDPQGRRIQTVQGASSTHYLYQGTDILAEYDATWGKPQAVYVHSPAWDDPLIRLTGDTASPASAASYYHADGLGNVLATSRSQTVSNLAMASGTTLTTAGDYWPEYYPPASLKDGITAYVAGSGWLGSTDAGAAVSYGFATPQYVDRVAITAMYGYEPSTWAVDVQAPGTSTWVQVTTGSAADFVDMDGPNAIKAEKTFPTREAQAVRIRLLGSVDTDPEVWLTEVQVYTAAQVVDLQRFDAWGNKTASSGEAIPRYGFQGREPTDAAIGLIYFRNRYYDPEIGRFVSRDPSGMPDGVNRYAFVRNNPVNYVDPLGLNTAEPMDLANQSTYPSFTGEQTNVAGPAMWVSPAVTALPTTMLPEYSNMNQAQPKGDDSYQGLFGEQGSGTPPSLVQSLSNALGNLISSTIENLGNLIFDEADTPATPIEPTAGEPASEQTAKDIAKQIERDLGKDARRDFHDIKGDDPDRTIDQLKQDARDIYNDAGKSVPRWLR